MSFEIEEPKENRFTIKEPKKVPNYNQNPIMPYLTEKPGDENLIDDVVGGAEAGLSFATGMTALPIAGLAGLWQSGFGMYPEKGAETVEKVANYLTYKPTTTKGQETSELINKPFEYLEKAADWAGNKAYQATGRAEIGSAVKTGMMFAIPGVAGKGIKLTFKTALNSIPEGAARDSFRKTIIQEAQRTGETVDQTTNRLLPVPVKEKTPVMPVNSKGEVLYEKPLPAMSEEAIKQAMVRVANQKVKKGKSRVTVEEGEYPIADPTLQAQAIAGKGAEAPWVIEEPGVTPTTNLVKKMSGDSSVTLGSGPWQSMYEKFFPEKRTNKGERLLSTGEIQDAIQTGFYSKLGEVVNNKVGGKITPDQLFKVLKNNGVKDSEIKWAGLNEFRDTYKDQLVTKEQLTNYLKEHELKAEIKSKGMTLYTGLDPKIIKDLFHLTSIKSAKKIKSEGFKGTEVYLTPKEFIPDWAVELFGKYSYKGVELKEIAQIATKVTSDSIIDFGDSITVKKVISNFKKAGLISTKEAKTLISEVDDNVYSLRTFLDIVKDANKMGEAEKLFGAKVIFNMEEHELGGEVLVLDPKLVTFNRANRGIMPKDRDASKLPNWELAQKELFNTLEQLEDRYNKGEISKDLYKKLYNEALDVRDKVSGWDRNKKNSEEYYRVGKKLYSGIDLSLLKPYAKAFMEFWKPTSTLPHGGATYLDKRYKLLGSLDLTERAATNYYEELAILDPDSKIKIFQAIDGTIPKSALTKDQKVLADRITELNNQIGKMAVDEGLMSEETFKANKDNYIHYMYLRHVLGENTVGASSSGTAKMDLSWAKQRKDLTPEQRAEIGLIEDISIAQPIGMAKTISDIHMNRFFNSIAADSEVTWQPKMVNVDGKNWGIGRLVQEVENQRRLARKEPNSAPIKTRLDKLEDALDRARADSTRVPDEYTQIPESSRYGDLSGAYVLKPIARDIMPVWNGVKNTGELSRMVNEFIKFEERAMAAFKIGKTALNIPTASRNVVSNFLQLNMSGMSIPRVIEYVIEALRHYSGASPKLSLARENGLLKTNFAQGEIGEILTVFEEMNKSPLGVWKNAKKLANYYGKIDDVFKMAKFLEQLDKGKDVPIAIREAQKWGMDYSLAHPLIKLSRRHIAPFVTYQYKIAPLVAESLYKRPWVIGKYIASVYGINEAVKSMMNLDENDWKRLRSMLPSYIRKNNTFVVVPWKSPEGGVQWVNLEYFFPWQSFNAIGKSMIRGDVRDIPNQLGIGHPLMDVLYTLSKSSSTENPPIDMFTHREIYNRLDSPTEKAAKTSLWVFQKWLPTMLTTEGTAGKITKAALGVKDSDGRVMGWDKALLSLVGVNINNPSERAANIEQISTINSWRKDLLKIARSNASEAKKAQAQRMFENKVNKYLSERFGGNQ